MQYVGMYHVLRMQQDSRFLSLRIEVLHETFGYTVVGKHYEGMS